MYAIERIRREGEAKGIAKNEAKAQKRLLEIAKVLIKEGNSIEHIANLFGIEVQKLADFQLNG